MIIFTRSCHSHWGVMRLMRGWGTWLQLVLGIMLLYTTQRRNVFIERYVSGCDGNAVSILSANVNHDIGVLYLGLGNRYALGYTLLDLVMAKSKEEPIK